MALARKPLAALLQEEEKGQLVRELRLVDLVAIGIGSTVGTGVFSIVGSVAASDCGPSVVIAILIGSFGCLLTGNAYVKLSRAIPSTGSVYAYAYHCLGEVFAVVCACCLTLEYAACGSAVAVSWGLKFSEAVQLDALARMDLGPVVVNWAAAMICVPCVLLLLQGLALGKTFSNFMTLLKCAVVVFIIVTSLFFFKAANVSPLVPPRRVVHGKGRYGLEGLFRASVDCFFAFVGFDEVCCLAGEAKDPKKDMPRAVVLAVGGTAFFTFMAGLGIVGMQHYTDIDPDDGFVVALRRHGWPAAAWVVSIGELVTLPLLVFVSMLPQARLFYAVAMDGLLPSVFTRLSGGGVLLQSNLIIGVVCTLVAMVVDFDKFNDMISAGVLLSFIMCNCSLIMLSLEPSAELEEKAGQLSRTRNGTALALYCACVFACMVLTTGLLLPSTVLGMLASAQRRTKTVAGTFALLSALAAVAGVFRLAGAPRSLGLWTPVGAIAFNSWMLSTLSLRGFITIAFYFGVLLGLYFLTHHSKHRTERLRLALLPAD